MFPYRDDNPTSSIPIITPLLILINAAAFFYLGLRPDYARIVSEYGFIPAEFKLSTVFTSMFLHGSLFHLIFNMWYLWLFGDNLEDKFGKGIFLIFYLLGGVVAVMIHSMMAGPEMRHIPSIGASGAISAVMGGYVTLFPRARIRMAVFFYYFTVIRINAIWFLGIWFVEQLFASGSGMGTGIAYWAHIGGFVYGVVFTMIMRMTFLAGRDFSVPDED